MENKETIIPPFPDKMTFREMLTNLFNVDFLTPNELTTICDAGELYADGCLKEKNKQAELIMIERDSYKKAFEDLHDMFVRITDKIKFIK